MTSVKGIFWIGFKTEKSRQSLDAAVARNCHKYLQQSWILKPVSLFGQSKVINHYVQSHWNARAAASVVMPLCCHALSNGCFTQTFQQKI